MITDEQNKILVLKWAVVITGIFVAGLWLSLLFRVVKGVIYIQSSIAYTLVWLLLCLILVNNLNKRFNKI